LQILAYQPALRPALPCIYGPLEYRILREQLERIDAILSESKLDDEFLALSIAEQGVEVKKLTAKAAERFVHTCALVLRANIARGLVGLSHREFCVRVTDSALLQWFLHLGGLDQLETFAKSSSGRFGQWVSAEGMRKINERLVILAGASGANGEGCFGLEKPVDCTEAFFDTTCQKANIHFPVDWVLLRDAVRTLMKATLCIRRMGIKERMPQEPEDFLRDINKLCMAMSAQWRSANSMKGRKRVLRVMKKLVKRVAAHARSHRDALENRLEQSTLSGGQARVIIERIDGVLKQLPAAIKQAHERIIGGRLVDNADKILSLYDEDIHVIVRGKSGAEVEFGNKLSLVESRQGLVLTYELHQDNPSDSALVVPLARRMTYDLHLPLKAMWGDRGTQSKKNETWLEAHGIQSGLCPRDPEELAQKLQEPGAREGMKRRAGTEARIAIFKNVFMGSPTRGKSFTARNQACGWAVLAHNLWVLARLPKAKARKQNRPPPEDATDSDLRQAA